MYSPPGGAYTPPPSGYAGQTGGVYVPDAPPNWAARRQMAPSAGLRMARGLGWGALWGQWWTLLNAFWFLVFGGYKQGGFAAAVIIAGIFVFGFVGSLVGLIEGAVDASVETGSIIGIVAGLIFAVIELVLLGFSASGFVSILFWIYTGRRVGSMIASKIQQPVEG